jgi:rhodanese-related sulfurtransferase/DNA-binding transcriptional ArsR family regulator
LQKSDQGCTIALVAHRQFKDRLYPEFARIAQALASDRRLELIDLLAQGPRHVEALAQEAGISLANASQHLLALKQARLVSTEKHGTKVVYRLASPSVLKLWLDLRSVAEERLPEIERIAGEFVPPGAEGPPEPVVAALPRARTGEVFLIDVRPREEFANGHLPGAVNFPPLDLPDRLAELPRDIPVVAYCRGRYCLFADDAVALLRREGFDAHRLDIGWSEWRALDESAATRGDRGVVTLT